MRNLNLLLLGIIVVGLSLSGCKKDTSANSALKPIPKATKDMVISPNFKLSTVKNLLINVTALDNQNKALTNVRLNILTNYRASGGKQIMTASTDAAGIVNMTYSIPDYLDSVVVASDYIGLPSETKVSTKSGQIVLKLGGLYPVLKSASAGPQFKSVSTPLISTPLGTWNSSGVPNYLEPTNDVIDAKLLSDLNTLLPERVDMRANHPELLLKTNQTNLVLTDDCNVWVSFIFEGAGWQNALGYYYYSTDNPPKTLAEMPAINVIFPNCSMPGSGGDLHAGNKVKLKGPLASGAFPKNTTIGWALMSNGYSGNTVGVGNGIRYSDLKFNYETDDNLKKHFILLYDRSRYNFILTVEDYWGDNSGCDHDFNDCMFNVIANPIQNVDVTNMPSPVFQGSDSDGDGVADNFDDYPNDPTKAFDSYYPSKGTFGSIAFEDQWPFIGDYDMNDMVIDCNFNQVTNANNLVVEIDGQVSLRAMGAAFKNGFGFQLPVVASVVSKCTVISKKTGLPITLSNIVSIDAATGLEKNQDKAVVILADNGFNLLPQNGSGIGVNTTPLVPWSIPDTLLVTIQLKTPVSASLIGNAPYNPFIFVDGVRGQEVHLPDQVPTSLVNTTFFKTGSDDSDPASGRYYRTKNNMSWGISFADHYDYPIEKSDIIVTHLHFADWAISGGTLFKDWYLDKTGYRTPSLIYKKP
jgi:LruC domain-containing protein